MVAFDGLYIPALFLTGSAGKSAEAAAKATAAMQRLREQWPARRAALASVAPGQRTWARALDAVQHHLQTADAQVTQAAWAASHETLEHVREALFEARHALGLDHPLDLLTAYPRRNGKAGQCHRGGPVGDGRGFRTGARPLAAH